MEEKCFCHFNGYKVKDADARSRIEVLENKTTQLENYKTQHETEYNDLNNKATNLETNLTSANNEISRVNGVASTNSTNIGDINTIETESKNIVGAVNEINSKVNEISTDSFTESLNKVVSDVGTIDNLETTDKTNLVGAINEVNEKSGRCIIEGYLKAQVKVSEGTQELFLDLTKKVRSDGTDFKYSEGVEISFASVDDTLYKGVKVPNGYTSALVSASISVQDNGTAANAYNLYVMKNGEVVGFGRVKNESGGGTFTIPVPETLIDVNPGEFIGLKFYRVNNSTTHGTIDIKSAEKKTYLKVEFLK